MKPESISEFAPPLVWPSQSHGTISVALTCAWDSPTAPRDLDAPIVSACPEPHRWMSNLNSVESRLGMMGRAGTQAVFGEPVIVVNEHSGWSEVRLPWQPTSSDPLGYPGWIPSAHINREPQSAQFSVATDRLAHMGSTFSMGRALSSPAPATISFRGQLEKFLGISYLWTGISGWGVDCSGLIHVAARSVGLCVPRDSFDQFDATKQGEMNLNLLFFVYPEGHERAGRIRHVAYNLGDATMLHAPRAGFVVEVVSTDTEPYRSDAVEP